MVSSHNDLHPTNFLLTDSQRLLVIDWESAFHNDRYVDLAIISQSFGLNEKESELLLNNYFGQGVTEVNKAKFFLMQQVCQLYQGLLMLKFAAACKPEDYMHNYDFRTARQGDVNLLIQSNQLLLDTYEGQLYYGKVCLNEALISMRSEKFYDALKWV
jgi:thiamine kinase-like enzyme